MDKNSNNKTPMIKKYTKANILQRRFQKLIKQNSNIPVLPTVSQHVSCERYTHKPQSNQKQNNKGLSDQICTRDVLRSIQFRHLPTKLKAESFLQKRNTHSLQVQLKMNRSISRFLQKENNLRKTLLQRKKQKKYFSIQSFQTEETEFLKALLNQPLLKEQVNEEDALIKQFPIQALPNLCFDSQFIFKREGSCLALANNKLYLFGGAIRRKIYFSNEQSTESNNDLLFHSYDQDRWIKQNITNKVSVDSRNLIQHTTNNIGRKLIIITGGMIGDSQKTLSKFNISILIYNVDLKRMQQIPWNVCLRCHSSVSFQNFVVVHGGFNGEGKVNNQIHIIGVFPNGQQMATRICKYQTNESLFHHQMVTTLEQQKSFRINLRQNNGIFVFGGENQHGHMDNSLKLLKIYTSSELEKKNRKNFQVLKTVGEGPCPRKNHSMNLIASKNFIVIVGGLNQNSYPLSDVWVIQLIQLKWCKIETQPTIQSIFGGIHKHAAVSNHNSLYIMGGKHEKSMGSSSLFKVDFNIRYEKKMKQKKETFAKINSCWSINQSAKLVDSNDEIMFSDG